MTLEPELPAANPFNLDQMKLLAMMLVENRSNLNYAAGLAPYGQRVFASLQGVIAREVLGIEVDLDFKADPVTCACCGAPIFTISQREIINSTPLSREE